MKNSIKNIIVTISFILIIFGFMLANVLMPDAALSKAERRQLTQMPGFSMEKLLTGALFEQFEKYSLDQFVFRDIFRSIKAFGTYHLFRQKDNNRIYIIDKSIYKMEYPLNEKSVINAANKLNEVYSKYLEGLNVSYAIIPDKNYFVAREKGYLHLDYDRMIELMAQNVKNMNYIDLFKSLTEGDYYRTDIHWRQEKILSIADKLLSDMGNKVKTSNDTYIQRELFPFYGSYYGQAASSVPPDTLVYLTSELLDKAEVYDYELKNYGKVYTTEKFEGMDPYDIFLSGAKPLLKIINPENPDGRELILFRDSFGSSIAPLMLTGYSSITLIDLRYITTDYLGELINFERDSDVLFLYNTQILNNSYMLK